MCGNRTLHASCVALFYYWLAGRGPRKIFWGLSMLWHRDLVGFAGVYQYGSQHGYTSYKGTYSAIDECRWEQYVGDLCGPRIGVPRATRDF